MSGLNLTPPVICLVTDRRRLTDPVLGDGIESLLCLIERAAHTGIDLIQIRESDLEDRVLEDVVRRAVVLTSATSTRVVVNDRVDVALAAGAAGVHLKETSMLPEQVRQLAPKGWLVGRSVHHTTEAVRVATPGVVDYLVVGTVFETGSKPGQAPMGSDGLAAMVHAVEVPVLAIGGVTVDRARLVGQSGAAGLAAIAEFAEAGHRLDVVVKNIRLKFDTGRSELL